MLKKELRTKYKKKREELSSDEIHSLSLNIQDTLLSLLGKLSFNSINCFLSSSLKKEVKTAQLIQKLFELGKTISVPVSDYEDSTLKAVKFKPDTKLTNDKYGIPTPEHIQVINSSTIDIVLVPLLCFDTNGYRCGYGKGMYDRFLSTCKKDVITIGLSFFPAVEAISNIDKFDIPLQYVVYDKKIVKFY